MNVFIRSLIKDALNIALVEMPVLIKKFRQGREAARQEQKDSSPQTDAVMQRLEAVEGGIEALTKATDDLARAIESHEKRITRAMVLSTVAIGLAILAAVLAWWRSG
jgi:ferric-dicitrate binding protein FerR (iron transport regulator)